MPDAGSGCRCVLCAPPPREFGNPWVHRMLAEVRTRQWSVLGVAEDDEFPGWAYTVGLTHSHGLAELAMFGLAVDDLQHWVSTLAAAMTSGRVAPAASPIDPAVLGLPVHLRPMDPSWHEPLFGMAHHFYQGSHFRVRQIVWADRSGRYPWDDGVTEQSREGQPPGWLPADRAGHRWLDLLTE
ncbi:hypothetical protein AMIS_30180 [Actinoplanes missouriensis 431]|uniref:DUF4262 domain-containing protein n=1 Tax=Actinoplanes missouriensis (strain ATCC 14538 / DSM 43046 / CBS 188.64 / JCM 3121 / NBRC 102363 / NCIMB 12654 / NRRL B-3342 / UNCC 431) TaxID=512565 RepID=I0H5F1_ACTM4|nr:DUF4262 domain-containing protein [Actinoplanes missouriensis]BAL88238.1 hypothetical protein AMIS_30180 [Actinoplanes missouriensis 431]